MRHLAKQLDVSPSIMGWHVWCGFEVSDENKALPETHLRALVLDPVAADCQDCLRAYQAAARAHATKVHTAVVTMPPEAAELRPGPVQYVEGPRPGAELKSPINIRSTFEAELAGLLNRMSLENGSDTPDFILARFLGDCLLAWNGAVNARVKFKTSGEPERPSMEKPITGW